MGKVNELRRGKVGKLIAQRIREFKDLGRKGNEEWFSELCFCILTARSDPEAAIEIQRELGVEGFLMLPREKLAYKLKNLGYKGPYNKRAEYIDRARKFSNIKDILLKFPDIKLAREWLAENVDGTRYKEASHFLRNVGFDDVAILDTHIITTVQKHGLVKAAWFQELAHDKRKLASSILGSKRRYQEIEDKLGELAEKVDLSLGELDLYLWYLEKRKVLK